MQIVNEEDVRLPFDHDAYTDFLDDDTISSGTWSGVSLQVEEIPKKLQLDVLAREGLHSEEC